MQHGVKLFVDYFYYNSHPTPYIRIIYPLILMFLVFSNSYNGNNALYFYRF